MSQSSKPRRLFPLDGTWHNSVATKAGALHIAKEVKMHGDGKEIAIAYCSDGLFLNEDNEYSEQDATAHGRTICARCLKKEAKNA